MHLYVPQDCYSSLPVKAPSSPVEALQHSRRTLTHDDQNSSSNTKVDEVIDRLINEVRSYKARIDNARNVISTTGRDHERLTLLGGINKLIRENKELEAKNKVLNKELDNLSRKK